MSRLGRPHYIEYTAALLIEAVNARVKSNVEYFKRDDGSPIFSVVLSPADKLQRFNDPAMRQQIEERVFAKGGIKGLEGYRNEMLREQTRQRNMILNNPARGMFGGGR